MHIVLALLAGCAPPEPIAPVAREPVPQDAAGGAQAGTGTGTGDDHDASWEGTGGGGTAGGTGGSDAGDGGMGGTGGTGGTGTDADHFEGWPATDFFPRYCGDCHPHLTTNGWDWQIYGHVVEQYDHIYCGVGLDEVPECGGHHEPGHLPQGNGPRPTTDERLRLIAWMDAGMPRLADLQ